MKILLIRGENLASLAGPFEVLLEQPPLRDAGLFAITGATGAGKSTLLDAMCLALFDKMPRFGNGRGGAPIGRDDEEPNQRLASLDVRGILRRGTNSAYAEVEYMGRDERRYRARWSVQRTRGRADGTIKQQELNLVDIASGSQLGRNKTEVLAKIESTLGLTYDQFRRSALLAQGDFAAFLRATNDERANLLEQMTGTEVYSKLSKAAFQKHKEVQEALRHLDAELGNVKVLEAQERTHLEESILALEGEKKQANGTVRNLATILQWWEAREALQRHERGAIEAEEAARQMLVALTPLREELARVERAHGMRPLRDTAIEAEEALSNAITRRDKLKDEARQASERREETTRHRAACNEDLGAAMAKLEEARPMIEEAGQLDVTLGENEQSLSEASNNAILAATALREASLGLSEVQGEITQVNVRARELEGCIEKHLAREPLVEQWPRWEEALKHYAAMADEESAAARAHAALQVRLGEATRKHEDAQAAVQRAEEAHRGADDAWRAADEALQRGGMTETLRTERDRLVARREHLLHLTQIIEQSASCLRDEEAENKAEALSREQIAAEESEAKRMEARLNRIQAKFEEAERARDQARTQLELSDYRALLCEGEPCPLCGAKRHPYAKEDLPLARLVDEHKKRVGELRSETRDAQNRVGEHRAQAASAAGQADEAARRARRARKKHAGFVKEWTQAPDALDFGALPDERGGRKVRKDSAVVEARLEAIKGIEEQSVKLSEQARKLRGVSDTRRAEVDAARKALSTTERAAEEARQALDNNTNRRVTAGAARVRSEEMLAAPFVRYSEKWRAKLAANPAQFMSECAKAVSEYVAWRTEQAQCATRHADLEIRHHALTVLEGERKRIVEQREGELGKLKEKLALLQTKRAAMFGGKTTAAVRAEYDRSINTLRESLEKAITHADARSREANDADAAARGANEAAAARDDAAKRARSALSTALAAEGLDRASLDEHLRKDAAWVGASRAEVEARDTAVKHTSAVREARVRAREAHDANEAPTMAPEEAAAQHSVALSAHEQATQAHADRQARLRSDDEARRVHASKADVLVARRKDAQRWAVLNDLIGHSDGKTFRKFAQSLTLDALLSHANDHLSELAPRYRLMRVPGHDLELQIVDQDMADELRSVNSLSGGESFLVSLALALGLSSLAAQDVRVETLFIDEGFGTLDPETLDTALAALETLQATGRQVGLISHVAGLAEQIGTEVQVARLGGGRSRVRVRAAPARTGVTRAGETETREAIAKGKQRGSRQTEVEA